MKLKKVCIRNRAYYYFDDILKSEDFDVDKTLIGSKSLRIRFDKIDGFIRIYGGTRYLTLFGSEK